MLYRLLVIISGSGLLIWSTFLAPNSLNLGYGLVILLFVALQVNFPLVIFRNEYYLTQIIPVAGGLIFGGPTAGWAATLGILLGGAIRQLWRGRSARGSSGQPVNWLNLVSMMSRLNVALLLALMITGYNAGLIKSSPATFEQLTWLSLAIPLLLFALMHVALFAGDILTLQATASRPPRWDFLTFALIELLPLPFIMMGVIAFPTLGIITLLALGGVPPVIATMLDRLMTTRQDLERRVQELSTLYRVSQVLRSTLDLENLLSVIQLQISQLLAVENFYVALVGSKEDHIWYPLAVKSGQRQHWASRPMEDRLTDRVIRSRIPIVLNRNSSDGAAVDLPPSELTPTAWIGVPLISSDRIIGCLALFSLEPKAEFNQANLDLLMTLSGQISVAIENALLYEQAQRRTTQLETLNQLSKLTTASLDPQQVLAQVCQSVTQVGGGKHSAIFLLDESESQVWLAHTYALSAEFIRQNQSFSIAHSRRARCLRTGQPTLISNLSESDLEQDFKESLQNEGIQAIGDFPLITPEGQIGFLSVYFDASHTFPADETGLVQTYASQAALAVSNARLYARTDMALSQRAHQLTILEAVGRELSAAVYSERLFEMILDYALDFTNSPWGSFGLYNPVTRMIEVKARRGYSSTQETYSVERGISGRAVRIQQKINVGDVSMDPDYVDLSGGAAHSQLSIPLIHEGRVLGELSLENPQFNGFSASDEAFISQLANQAAIAVVNAELYADVAHGRDRLAAVLNSVRESILMVQADGRITLANQATQVVAGLSPSELAGARLVDLSPQALGCLGYSPEEAKDLMSALEQGQVPITPKTTFKISDAKPERILERSALPVWGYSGRAIGWMIVLRDVSEENQIAQARELITETLVHDLRSPLSAVMGALDVMEEIIQQGDQMTDLTAQAMLVAKRSSQRILGMIESLLDISRMQSGKLDLMLAPVNLQAVVANAMANYVQQANEFGIIIRNEIPFDLPMFCADQSKLTRVLVNLLDNSLKFTPSGGQVIFSAEPLPDEIIAVKVIDSGPGVPEEYRDKIFERFTQIPGQHGRRRGSGLGLTFCRLAVEAHGGRIWVEEREGGGSVFTFTLPLNPDTTCN